MIPPLGRALAASLALTLAPGALATSGPAAAQGGYYEEYDEAPRYERRRERRYEERIYEDDRYFRERMRYYGRDAVARREARRRARAERDDAGFAAPPRQRQNVPFFERLFGARAPEEEPRSWTPRGDPGAVEVRPKTNRIRRKPPAEAAPAAPPSADVAAQQPTVPPTTFVAVFGDSIAEGLAGGLSEAFADAPELAVKRYVKANAGLVRADYHDFVEVVRKAVAADPITFAVIDLGVNDRQPFLGMREAQPLTDRWRQRYNERIDAMLAPFKERKIQVYWVGLAPSESAKASSDHTALNALARERVEAAGGVYVDVWEGFVDDGGDYVAVGPQLDGQTAKLRLDDGVHFSKAGARKLAHYVEQELRKVFQPKPQVAPDALLSALTPGTDPAALLKAPAIADRPRPLAGPLVVLTAPRRAEGGALAGMPAAPEAAAALPAAERVLVRGEALDPDPGRLDDHRWTGPAKPAEARAVIPTGRQPEPGPRSD